MIFWNLRSVVGQVHRQSRWIGTRRSFSVESTQYDSEISFSAWFFTRGAALLSGIGVGYYMLGGDASDLIERQQKNIKTSKENFKKREEIWSDIAATSSKS